MCPDWGRGDHNYEYRYNKHSRTGFWVNFAVIWQLYKELKLFLECLYYFIFSLATNESTSWILGIVSFLKFSQSKIYVVIGITGVNGNKSKQKLEFNYTVYWNTQTCYKRVNLETLKLSERSQLGLYSMIPLIWKCPEQEKYKNRKISNYLELIELGLEVHSYLGWGMF